MEPEKKRMVRGEREKERKGKKEGQGKSFMQFRWTIEWR
jgi:hypothetical protein